MKLNIKLIGTVTGGLSLIASIAHSESLLQRTCQSCQQIAPPVVSCKGTMPIKTFCGSESWTINGTSECKLFSKQTKTCALGGTQTWTEESWFGAGTSCNSTGDDHNCY